jgi:urease accessory protein
LDPARAALRVVPDARGHEPERRGPTRVGRDGLLDLRFERRAGRTVLVSRRFHPPLQFLEPIDLAQDGSAFAILLNPAGGILGGDRLQTDVHVGAGAHVGVATPSATRVYRTAGPASLLRTAVRVGEGATLEHVPHHLIPHPGARVHQSLHVELAPTSRLLLYDGLALGRHARGERFAFASLASEVRVDAGGKPLYWDRLRLRPAHAAALGGLGGAEGLSYLGTFVFAEPRRERWDDLVDDLRQLFSESAFRGGVSLLSRGGCVARVLAPSAHVLASFLREAWAVGRYRLLGRPPLDLRLG